MNLETLRQYKSQILAIAEAHRAENVRVFGSVVRGEATEDSDVDILVHLKKGASLLDLCGLEVELNDLLGIKVDVVFDEAIYPPLVPFIMGEAVPL